MGHAAIAGVGWQQDFVLALWIVQRIVKPGDHPRGVAEGGMLGHVLDALAVDENGAVVGERGQIFRAGLRRGNGNLARGFVGCGHGILPELSRGLSTIHYLCHLAGPLNRHARPCAGHPRLASYF
jgi:hypothetical protein